MVEEVDDDEPFGEGDNPNEYEEGMVPDDDEGGAPATQTGASPAVPVVGPGAGQPAVDDEETDDAPLG